MHKTANHSPDAPQLTLTRAYVELPVQPGLAAHVVCTWRDAPRPLRQPVLPDACIDLVWDGKDLVVAGPDTRPVPITSDATFVGVRFRPGSAPGFLGVSASELLDARVPLFELWGRPARELAERLGDQPDLSTTSLLADALVRKLDSARPSDRLVDEVVYELSRNTTNQAVVSSLTVKLGTSERTLRRRCADALGYGPKTLDRILRFRRALRLLRKRLPLAEVAFLAGYADQAHFTHECHRLATATPAALADNDRGSISANGCN